jgi:hypothetical protein
LRHRRLGLLVGSLALWSLAPTARAQDREVQERTARKACLSGDYATGVGILSDLFLDTRNPTYIFNQGRCYEQNNRNEEAIARFREYLRKATNISPADRADTERHIADCQALLSNPAPPPAEAVQPSPAAGLAPVSLAAPSAAATPASPPVSVEQRGVASRAATPGRPGLGLRIAGIACGVVGAALVGMGIYYYTQARSISDKVSRTTNPSASDQQEGKDAEAMQWVFYGAGAGMLATGAVLYLLGRHFAASEGGGESRIAPMVGPGLAGISARGTF